MTNESFIKITFPDVELYIIPYTISIQIDSDDYIPIGNIEGRKQIEGLTINIPPIHKIGKSLIKITPTNLEHQDKPKFLGVLILGHTYSLHTFTRMSILNHHYYTLV